MSATDPITLTSPSNVKTAKAQVAIRDKVLHVQASGKSTNRNYGCAVNFSLPKALRTAIQEVLSTKTGVKSLATDKKDYVRVGVTDQGSSIEFAIGGLDVEVPNDVPGVADLRTTLGF